MPNLSVLRTALSNACLCLQAVYGSYAAVLLADASALHDLAAKLPFFFQHRSWQKGAYQVALLADALT